MATATSEEQNLPLRDASDVYDRQIRLWGAEAQSKISSASILYVNVTGVSSEILKNLVLAGVQAAICDGRPYPDALRFTPSSFLPPGDRNSTEDIPQSKKRKMTVAQAMQQHVHELNPLLKLPLIEERPLEEIPDSFFKDFEVVIASRISLEQAKRIAAQTQLAGNKFILADCFGMKGCAMMDLGPNHVFRREIGKDKLSDPVPTKPYLPLSDILAVKLGQVSDRWNKTCPTVYTEYRSILQYHAETGKWPSPESKEDFSSRISKWLISGQECNEELISKDALEIVANSASYELSPVCAILGGVLGNEVVKALSGKGQPANNLLLFDSADGGCRNFLVK